ncbi:MAG: class I SAM-dependent methyltransferase [Pyrinomonadaceae bacterium]
MKNESRRSCPACSGLEAAFCGSKNNFDIFVCDGCESIFTSRLPADDETEDYDAYYTDANLAAPDFISDRLREILSQFGGYRKTNHLLDIGFGSGTILDEAQNQGWDAFGTEVSKTAFDHLKKRGHHVFHGTLWSAGFEDDFFDVVTASEILEHLPEPAQELREIARILRPGGLFWATTPSAKSLSFRLMKEKWTIISPPEHTQIYSKVGAAMMLRNAGFENVKILATALNPAEIVNYYRSPKKGVENFNRVGTGYELNEQLTKSQFRRRIKDGLNQGLNLFQLGDSLKIFAQKPIGK